MTRKLTMKSLGYDKNILFEDVIVLQAYGLPSAVWSFDPFTAPFCVEAPPQCQIQENLE